VCEYVGIYVCLWVDERDVFDKLFEEAPEKLEPVKRVRHYSNITLLGKEIGFHSN